MPVYGGLDRLTSEYGTELHRSRDKEVPKAIDGERRIMYLKIIHTAKSNDHELPSIATMEEMNWKELAKLLDSTKRSSRHSKFLSSCGRVNSEQVHNRGYSDTDLNSSLKELHRQGLGIRRQKYFSPHKLAKPNTSTKDNTATSPKEQERESGLDVLTALQPTPYTKFAWGIAKRGAIIPEFESRENRTSCEEPEIPEFWKRFCILGTSTASGKVNHPPDSTSIKVTSASRKDPTDNMSGLDTHRVFSPSSKGATPKYKSLKDTEAHMEPKAFNKEFDVGWIDADEEIVKGDEWELIEEKKSVRESDEYDEWVCLPQEKKTWEFR